MAFDPYQVLKVSRKPTRREIEDGYRRLAEIYDPSRYVGIGSGAQDEAARRLNELRHARAVLLERHRKLLPPMPKVVVTPRALAITIALVLAIVAVTAIAISLLVRG